MLTPFEKTVLAALGVIIRSLMFVITPANPNNMYDVEARAVLARSLEDMSESLLAAVKAGKLKGDD